MRILQVMAGAPRGGAETAFVDMCLALHETGEIIEVVTRANDVRVPPLAQAGIKIHTLPFGGALDVFTRWKMTRIIQKFKPNIVQTWMARAAAKTPAWNAGMNIPRYNVVARLGGYYKIKYFKSADHFVTITPDIREYLIKNGVAPGHVRHINNFAETENVEAPVFRADYNTPQRAKLILALGRLHESKAFDTLIKAVARMPEVYLWIAGEGPDRAALEKLIAALDVGGRVKLLGWRSDRAALFQAADICVFPSRYEPFGTVFVQAWAQKVPLVTTTADGPRQFVRDGEDGLIVPIDDDAAMALAIQKLIDDPSLAEKFTRNGFIRYQNEFTKAGTVQSYLAWYHELHASV